MLRTPPAHPSHTKPERHFTNGRALNLFFAGRPDSRRIHEAVVHAIGEIGPAEIRVSRSQIAFTHRRAFAWTWTPARYLSGECAPLVLSLALPRRVHSARFKQIVEPSPGWFMHHLELESKTDVDREVRDWIREAWTAADEH